jgi:hypothetical protein
MALDDIALISAFFSSELEPFLIGSDVLASPIMPLPTAPPSKATGLRLTSPV